MLPLCLTFLVEVHKRVGCARLCYLQFEETMQKAVITPILLFELLILIIDISYSATEIQLQ